MVNMTVAEFLSAIGTKVTTITYDTSKTEGVSLSDDGLTANVYNVAISGGSNSSNKFPASLVTADLRGLDVSGVTSMNYMFANCAKLTSLDVSNFDTSKVTDTGSMFAGCSNTQIKISDKWTLDTTPTAYDGTGLSFINIAILEGKLITSGYLLYTLKKYDKKKNEKLADKYAQKSDLNTKITGINISQSDYDALTNKDANTLYLITE